MMGLIGLSYRVIDVAAGDLGSSAAREVRHRGVDPNPGNIPRTYVDFELYDLSSPPS